MSGLAAQRETSSSSASAGRARVRIDLRPECIHARRRPLNLPSKMTSPNNSLVVNASGVQALSNALAVALYQATSGGGSPSAVATGGVATASIPPGPPGHVNVAQQTQPGTPSNAEPSSSQP